MRVVKPPVRERTPARFLRNLTAAVVGGVLGLALPIPGRLAAPEAVAQSSPAAPGGPCVGEGPCLPDDPPGLERSGDGRFAKGSAGPTGRGRGRVITVTSIKGDRSHGTALWALAQVKGPSKIVIPPDLHGTVVLEQRLKIDKPYLTWDCSQAPSDFAFTMKCTGPRGNCKRFDEAGPMVGATHDVIIFGCRGFGDFDTASPQVPANDLSVFATFNSVPVKYPWDDKWAGKTPEERKVAQDILWDRMGADRCRDDCLIAFDGVKDYSVLRSLVTRSWHPTTAGGIQHSPPGFWRERRRITYAYNVWDENGARAIRATEGIRDWRYIRNIISRRTSYVTRAGQRISPNTGLWLEDEAAGENDLARVVGNLEIPGPNMDPIGGGCVVGSNGGTGFGDACEFCANCRYPNGQRVPPTDYAKCNPKMVDTRWFFQGNVWSGDCITNPPGYDGTIRRGPGKPALPVMDEARPWSRVLDEVGPVNRNAFEQGVVDWIKARLP